MSNKEPKNHIRHTPAYPEPKQMVELGRKLGPRDKIVIPTKNKGHAEKHLKWAVRVAEQFRGTPGLQGCSLNYDLVGARLTIRR